MKNISDSYQLKTLNSEIDNKLIYEGKVIPNSNLSSIKDENILYGNDFSLIDKPSEIGSTRICLYINDFPIISIGKNILLSLLVILFVCIIYIIFWYYFFNTTKFILQKMFNYFFLIYLISHTLAIFINPGIPSFKYHKKVINDLRQLKINELDCSRCNICNLSYKLKDNINHCFTCNICYYEYDHHSFWIGHCIGKYNKYFFIIFIFSLIIFITICLIMVLLH